MHRGEWAFILLFALGYVCAPQSLVQAEGERWNHSPKSEDMGHPADPAGSCVNPRSAWAGNIAPTVYDMGVDADGNVLLAGVFWGRGTADFDPTNGVDERSGVGGFYDGFVTKILADGSYAWTYTIAGIESETADGVVADAEGSVFVTGSFEGTVDFDPTEGVDERTAVGDWNVFVTKLGPDGTYLWTLTFAEGDDRKAFAHGIDLDSEGNLSIAGTFYGPLDFDPTEETDIHSSYGFDIFVTKLAPDGSYHWTNTFGGLGADSGRSVAVDPQDRAVVVGTFRGTADFDPTTGVDLHTVQGEIEDIFVSRYLSDGTYDWTRTYPARLSAYSPIAIDRRADIYITSGFSGTRDFDPTEGVDWRTATPDPDGDDRPDIFVTSLGADGSYRWTWTVGGPHQDLGGGVAVDADGNVYVTGRYWETVDFDPGPAVDFHTSKGADDVFVTKINADLSYGWTRTFGEAANDWGRDIAIDPDGALIALGSYVIWPDAGIVVDFDPSCELDEHGSNDEGSPETFITKLICVEPTADTDGDGDIDLRDLAQAQNCFSGEYPAPCPTGCSTLDLDHDDDIDLDDFKAFREALDVYRRLNAEDIPSALSVKRDLADALIALGNTDEAEPLAMDALGKTRSFFGDEHLDTAAAMHTVGWLLIEQGRAGEAEPILRNCVRILQRVGLPAHMDWLTAEAENTLSHCVAELQRFDDAEALLLRSCANLRIAKGDAYVGTRTAIARVVALYESWNKSEETDHWRAVLVMARRNSAVKTTPPHGGR